MANREDQIYNQEIIPDEPKDDEVENIEGEEDDDDDDKQSAPPLPKTPIKMPDKETPEQVRARVAEYKGYVDVIVENAKARESGQLVVETTQLDKALANNPKLEKENKDQIAEILKNEAHEADCRFAKKWCQENAHLISIDLHQEQDPEVFFAWAKKGGAFETKLKETQANEGRDDIPNWFAADYAKEEKDIRRLENLAATISRDNPGVANRFFALGELNKKANDLGDQIEALDITQNNDLKVVKEKEWSDLFELRKKLYESIKGSDSLEAQIAEKTKNINDPQEVQKETARVYDVAFNELTSKDENLHELYKAAYEQRKNALLSQAVSEKTAVEQENIDKQFDGKGVDLAKLPAIVTKDLTPAEKKAIGLPEGKEPPSILESFSAEAPSFVLMVLMALSGVWLIGAFKEILPLAWEIGTKGWPDSLNKKVSNGVDALTKLINPQ